MPMSIQHDFPPLVTQTTERIPSGEVNHVHVHERLGEAGVRGAYHNVGEQVAAVAILPNHHSLQYRIDQIHSRVFADIEQELTDIDDKVNQVELELAVWIDRRHALEEREADLALFGRSARRDSDSEKVGVVIHALEATKDELLEQHREVQSRRLAAVRELEELEEADFRLLELGR